MGEVINFYRAQDEWGDFSNFDTRHPIKVDGCMWPTTEHYFQAMKFHKHPEVVERVRQCATPGESAKMGRDRSLPLRDDWEGVKDRVMYKAVRAKVDQHPDFRDLLLRTKGAKLVEHTVNDSYWGDGGNSTGQNMLGHILMLIREEVKEELRDFLEEYPKEEKKWSLDYGFGDLIAEIGEDAFWAAVKTGLKDTKAVMDREKKND
jgi:N-glycosidase YbiA